MTSSSAFSFQPPPPPLDRALLATACQLEPATLGHLLAEGFTGPEFHCFAGGDHPVAGTVVTCRADGDDNAIVHYAVSQLRPGDFLVVDRSGEVRHACFGGGLALAARQAGCSGVLILGPVTDLAELRQLGLPVWGTGLTALTSKRRYLQGSHCASMRMGEFVIEPGMLALGDENGVVFVATDAFGHLSAKALEMQVRQADRRSLIAKGASLGEINGTLEMFAKIRHNGLSTGERA